MRGESVTAAARPPLMESYWVLPGRFLAGEYPGHSEPEQARQRMDALLAAGMDTFIDLTQTGELPSYLPLLQHEAHERGLEVSYQRFPILDRGLPEQAEMLAMLNSIDAALANGHKVYLHCWGGVGRTATAVGCFLVRHGKAAPQALDQIAEWWQAVPKHRYYPRAPETPEQVRYILDWHEHAGEHRMNWHERYIQQAAWTRELRSYLFERIRWSAAQRVLEVGCGTGAILADQPMTKQGGSDDLKVPVPLIHGLDLAQASLRECREHAPATYLTCGDVLYLPYPSGIFDITYCHFLLLWVPDPLQALSEMKRVTKKSGYILALAEPDYAARSDKPPELAWLGQRQNDALQKHGAALSRGAELADLFYRAGIHLIETGPIRSPDSQAITAAEWENEWGMLEADLSGSVAPEEISRMKELDRQALSRRERILNVPTYFAWGQV